MLLENGANINAKATGGSNPGETPLHLAAYGGQAQVAKELLKKGASVNALSNSDYTPLRRAVDQGNSELIKLLLENGADINTRDKSGMTVLHVVAQSYDVALAEYLIKKGADINAKDKYSSFTPLDFAMDGEPEMIKLFRRHGGECTSC